MNPNFSYVLPFELGGDAALGIYLRRLLKVCRWGIYSFGLALILLLRFIPFSIVFLALIVFLLCFLAIQTNPFRIASSLARFVHSQAIRLSFSRTRSRSDHGLEDFLNELAFILYTVTDFLGEWQKAPYPQWKKNLMLIRYVFCYVFKASWTMFLSFVRTMIQTEK